MSTPYSLTTREEPHVLAWDTKGGPQETNAPLQPWREFWPPKNLESLSEAELKAKPWLTWKRTDSAPNEKPWYQWVNVFEGEVDEPCLGPGCQHCGGSGCVGSVLLFTELTFYKDR